MMRKISIVCLMILMAMMLTSCASNTVKDIEPEDSAKLLTEVKTTQFFTDEDITDGDVEKILSAGVNAPSAMNTQPWHFTAVTDKETTQKLADAMKSMKPPAMKDGGPGMPPTMPEGVEGKQPPKDAPKPPEGGAGFSKMPNKAGIGDAPLTIVISCKDGSELDSGLAVQNMSVEAQLLGYGTKIMTAPAMALNNDKYKEMLSVPQGQKIVAILIVGKPVTEKDNPDAVSSATTRNNYNNMVTVIGQ